MSRALGRYELLRPLARGGMAEVYLARRRAAGVEKWLVVKRIRAERATDVQFLDLFVREARLSMSLAHQNIVPVFDFGRIDDQVFLAMERVEGKDLGSSLARAKTPLSPLLAAFVAAECCQALDYAHRRKSPEGAALGIVHRDVTPRNVLLSWSGEVKLTDFGIAALAGDATAQLLGTPAYMAPEQARKEILDARTDVYAVGLVLREMATGTRARPGAERESLVAAARAGTLAPWPEHALPPGLVAIIERATAANPADRHADARALLAELDDFLVGERAAKRADAPARQLAAWLDAVWGEERDDGDASAAEAVAAEHLVSFLDDGALDVIGTGTQRSLLATAAEDEPAAAPSGVESTMTADLALARTAVGEPPPAIEPAPPPATGRRMAIVALALAAIVAALVVWRTRGEELAAPLAIDAPAVVAIDAPSAVDVVAQVAVDAPPADAAMPVDARLERAARDAGPRIATEPPRDAAPDAATARRRVTINAVPWAYFTIDDDPTRYETKRTVELAPGTHVLHFENPELAVTRDVTIEVPADRDSQHVEHLQRR